MRIYKLAKSRDHLGLKEALKTGCIDECLPGEYRFSAVSRLAAELDEASRIFWRRKT